MLHKYLKTVSVIAFMAIIFYHSDTSVFAAPTFTLNPKNGYVLEGNEFTLDILIDTDGEEVVKAKSVITFDPTLVEIVKAERNNTLFAQYPTDEQSTDNTNGVLMLTGFTQSGSGTPYVTSGSADVFARVTFKALWDGSVKFDWEYTGQDVAFKSVIMTDGSPPQNALAGIPASATFTIQDLDGTGSTGGTTNPPPTPTYVPNTGLLSSSQFLPGFMGVIGGVLLFIGTGFYSKYTKKMKFKKYRTIVDYEG